MNRKKALVTKTPKDYKLLWMAMPFIVMEGVKILVSMESKSF